jgi:hypothetical protein
MRFGSTRQQLHPDHRTWEKRIPQGDSLPKSQSFPMAFDEVRGVFLLVVDNPRNGSNRPAGALSSSTYTYDLKTNAYYRLPSGNMPPMGMNYMMVYDKKHAVSLLITGDWQHATTVWALETTVRTLSFVTIKAENLLTMDCMSYKLTNHLF